MLDSNSYDVRVIRGTDFYQIITVRIKRFNLSADFYAGKDILLLQEQDMNEAMLTTTIRLCCANIKKQAGTTILLTGIILMHRREPYKGKRNLGLNGKNYNLISSSLSSKNLNSVK